MLFKIFNIQLFMSQKRFSKGLRLWTPSVQFMIPVMSLKGENVHDYSVGTPKIGLNIGKVKIHDLCPLMASISYSFM